MLLIGSREGVATTIILTLKMWVLIEVCRVKRKLDWAATADGLVIVNACVPSACDAVLAMESEGQKDAQPKEEEKTHPPRADTPCITVAFYHFLPSLKPVSRPTIG
jgi:hypothetical protein